MKQRIKNYITAISMSLCSAAAAAASETSNYNVLILSGAGTENILTVSETENSGHSTRILVESADTLLNRTSWQRTTSSILEPGKVLQRGSNHVLSLSVIGQANQVAVSQLGAHQKSIITMQGRYNVVSVSQAGQFNTASVTQSGLQNTVVISQH